MKPVSITPNEIVAQFSRAEIDFLCNAVNETLEALQDWEFETRTGVMRDVATSILVQLRRVADAPSTE